MQLRSLALLFAGQHIDATHVPALSSLFGHIFALEFVELVAETVSPEAFEALSLHTPAQYIQMAERSGTSNKENGKITAECLYKPSTGALVATSAKWFILLARLPVHSAEFHISETAQIQSILADWSTADDLQLSFRPTNEPCGDLVAEFINRGKHLPHSKQCALANAEFHIDIQRRRNAVLAFNEIAEIRATLKSYKAMVSLAHLPDMELSASSSFYTIVFASGFSTGAGQHLDQLAATFGSNSVIRILRFDELNLIITFFGQLPGLYSASGSFYEGLLAISGWIGEELDASKIPFDDLQKSTRLQLILLLGRSKLGFDLPEGFEDEPDVRQCYVAVGLKQDGENSICIRITGRQGPYKLGRKCATYDMMAFHSLFVACFFFKLTYPTSQLFCLS